MKWTTFSHISTGSPVAYCLALMSILSGAEAASYPLVFFCTLSICWIFLPPGDDFNPTLLGRFPNR